MQERTEVFSVKNEDKSYCNCRLSIRLSEGTSNADLFAEELYSEARFFCDRIAQADREEERERRERFKITPYGYILTIESVKLSERISVLMIKYSFFARFPGGKREEGNDTILFDNVLNSVIPKTIFALFGMYLKSNRKISAAEVFRVENDEIVLNFDDNEERIGIDIFEEAYAKLADKGKKRHKGIDNFKKL